VLLQWCIVMGTFLAVTLGTAGAADPPVTLSFDWRVTGTVTRWVQGSDRETTTRRQMSGLGTITVVRDASPDVRFAFDFVSPEGAGSGVIPRAAEQTVDPNFSFPNPLAGDLPRAESRSLRGAFRRSGEGRVPPAFQIVYSETFVCRSTPEACRHVKRWDVVFIGSARRAAGAPPAP
jgi:hypothetical protein